MESVIRSEGNYSLFDVYDRFGPDVETNAMRLYWQTKPEIGWYCIYEAPENQPGLVPDCKNVNQILATHARNILKAGFDYIAFAATNLPTRSVTSELIQQRPAAVILEHWSALRQSGTPTPDFAVWNVIDKGANTWQDFLALYNDPKYTDMILKDPASGKKVFIAPTNSKYPPDPSIIAQIESNGGRNDVIVQQMWANLKDEEYANGTWSFMSPCRAGLPHPGNNGSGSSAMGSGSGARADDDGVIPAPDHPMSVVGGVGLSECRQGHTTGARLGDGTAVSVNPSFQLGYSSLPFDAAGKLDGLTMKRQFATAIRSGAQFLFVSGWNEFCAQPQHNHWHEAPIGSNFSYSQGLHFGSDPDRFKLFVDTYGSEIGRDIEPTETYGSRYTDITASCLRVIRLQRALGTPLHGHTFDDDGNELPCDVQGEVCCEFDRSMESWLPVWSLKRNLPSLPHADRVLSSNATWVGSVLADGSYNETCTWMGAQAQTFCGQGSLATTSEALQGPFQLRECVPGQPADRVQLSVCEARAPAPAGTHVMGRGADCDGLGEAGTGVQVGCMEPRKTSNTPRVLVRCLLSDGSFSFVLDGSCHSLGGSAGDGTALGFVH